MTTFVIWTETNIRKNKKLDEIEHLLIDYFPFQICLEIALREILVFWGPMADSEFDRSQKSFSSCKQWKRIENLFSFINTFMRTMLSVNIFFIYLFKLFVVHTESVSQDLCGKWHL